MKQQTFCEMNNFSGKTKREGFLNAMDECFGNLSISVLCRTF